MFHGERLPAPSQLKTYWQKRITPAENQLLNGWLKLQAEENNQMPAMPYKKGHWLAFTTEAVLAPGACRKPVP